MTAETGRRSVDRHAELDHPVIDCDGHVLELSPVFLDYLREVGDAAMVERYPSLPMVQALIEWKGIELNADDRRDAWISRGSFWTFPQRNTLDRATAILPALLSERLDEMGIDLSILYPTEGLLLLTVEDDDFRQAGCRAFNQYYMDLLRPFGDRMLPVAVIPMQSPEEAIDELEHAVRDLGFRAVVMQEFASRPIAKIERELPALAPLVRRPDFFGLDSPFDYDAVWAKCVELGVAVTFHGIGNGDAAYTKGSISNHIFNRYGAFELLHRRSAAAMFLGGVTRRFPTLNFAFQEASVYWACGLLSYLVGQWEKRSGAALAEVDPDNLDRILLLELVEKYGDEHTLERLEEIRAYFNRDIPRPTDIDEFSTCQIRDVHDIVDLFASRFYFGCEGDDPLYATAFRSEMLPGGATLRAIYGSDIGHFDVPDMAGCLEEAFEPVEAGAVTREQFRDFVFANPIRLHGQMNREFFKGTRVEQAATSFLAGER